MKKRILSIVSKSLMLVLILAAGFAQIPVTGCAAVESRESVPADIGDGEYEVEVKLEGGTGRATVNSPAKLVVKDGFAWCRIEWSSSKYDYMIIDGEKYLPVNNGGNSVFEIPVLVFNEPVEVIADTTAMSVPHEVEYKLIFSSPVSGGELFDWRPMAVTGILVIALIECYAAFRFSKKRGDSAK